MLATTTKDNPFHWEDHVRKVCLAYNSSVHPTTRYTPFYLMFGRQARLPVDLTFSTDKPEDRTPAEYATQLRDSLEQAYANVQTTMGTQLAKQKQLYDHKVHGKPFEPECLVWLHSPVVPRGRSRKLHHPWTGPWCVLKRISDATYRFQDQKTKRKRLVVHFNCLKLVRPGMRFTPEPDTAPLPDPTSDGTAPHHPASADPELPYQLVDADETPVEERRVAPRYPARARRAPDYFTQT